jgi:hypothetical protein
MKRVIFLCTIIATLILSATAQAAICGGEGRLYTLGYTCSDMAGNTADCETYVTVPHDMGVKP